MAIKQVSLKVKFINYARMHNAFANYNPVNYDETTMYRLAGGDDWRKVDADNLHYRGSCDTCNGFIYDDKSNTFYITGENGYDFDKFNGQNVDAKQVMRTLITSAIALGTFKSYNGGNKATGMVVTTINC